MAATHSLKSQGQALLACLKCSKAIADTHYLESSRQVLSSNLKHSKLLQLLTNWRAEHQYVCSVDLKSIRADTHQLEVG